MGKKEHVLVKHEFNTATGEVYSKIIDSYKLEGEPAYVKLYKQDIKLLFDLDKISENIIHYFAAIMDKENRVYLNKALKEKIANDLGYSLTSINIGISRLVKKGLIFREKTGTYIVTPLIFGQGKWKDMKKIILKITYFKEGRNINIDFDKQ